MANSYTRRINLYVNGKEVKNDISSISKAMYKLTNEQRRMTRGSKEYVEQGKKIRYLRGIMQKHNADIRSTTSVWGKMNKMAAGLLPAFGFAAILAGTKRMILSFAKFDDTLADAMKTTGLTRKEITELNKALQKIDTRSSQEELLGLVRIGGKLGIQGKNDLLGFAKAADKIGVSLKEDLGGDIEETMRKLGKLVNIFKLKEKFGMEDALLRVGSVINELGATSTANEQYMIEFTNRLSGFAPNAKLGITDVLGLASTLDQLGQTSEVSTTVLGKLLVAIGEDIPKFAGISGMAITDFSKLLEEDANEALLRVLESSKGSKKGLEGMVETLQKLGIDGQRSAGIIGALTKNTELLREEQAKANAEFEDGSSILTEFVTKNTTVQAELEKLGKWFKNIYLNTLNEINESLKSATTQFAEQLKEVQNLQSGLVPLIDEYEKLEGKVELSADEQARMKILIADIASITPGAITKFDLYGNAIAISADKAREFVKVQQAMLKMKHASAIGETEKTLEKQRKKLDQISNQMISGTKLMTTQTSSFGTSITQSIKLSSTELAELNAKLKETASNIKENELLLKGLTGDYLNDSLNKKPKKVVPDPAIGSLKTVGNKVYQWDGKTWKFKEDVGETEKETTQNALDLANKQQILTLKEHYAEEENMQKFLHARLLANELAYLQAKLNLETDEEKQLDLKTQIIDKQIQYNKAITDAIEPLRLKKDAVQEINQKLLEEGKLTHRNAEIAAKAAGEQTELNDELTSQANMYLDTIDVISRGMFNMMSGSEDAFKTFAKNILIFALEQLKVQAQLAAAGATIQSLSQPDSIATFGATGLVRAAIIVGLIEAAFAGLEGLVHGAFAKGGYTNPEGYTSGARMYIAGEKGTEWIAPNWMVQNPATANIIASLDNLRENRTGLNQNIIPQFANGGYSTLPTNTGGGVIMDNSNNQSSTTDQINRTLEALTIEIKELRKYRPSVAVETIERERANYIKIQNTKGL